MKTRLEEIIVEINENETFLTAEVELARRLTPTECERLQGFPDGWTELPTGQDTVPSVTP